jgi:hypothetical protein
MRYRWLEKVALTALSSESAGNNKSLWDPIRVSHFFLGRGWSHLLWEIRLKMTSLHDRSTLELPSGLAFLYPLLRLPLWFARIARRRHAQVRPLP